MLHEIYSRYPKNFPLPMILDGATGTELMKAGMPNGSVTEIFVRDHPEILKNIQNEYAAAGSMAVYSPTFGANSAMLSVHKVASPAAELNAALTAISVSLKKDYTGLIIIGDMSPTGHMLEPYGDMPFETAVDIYREQASFLAAAGADAIISETNISLSEARAAVIGAREACDLPVFVTLTVDQNGKTLCGDDLAASLLTLSELGIAAFGTNCSTGPSDMLKTLRPLIPYSVALGIPLIGKPNAGTPKKDTSGNTYFDMTAPEFGGFMREFLDAGVYLLGGCCGTDRDYIAELKNALAQAVLTPPKAYDGDLSLCAAAHGEIVRIDSLAGGNWIKTDENLTDNAMDAEGALYLDVAEGGAGYFFEAEPYISVPLVMRGDINEINRIKRRYCGKAIVV